MKKALPLFLLSWLFILFSCKEDDFGPAHHEKKESGYKRSIVSYQDMKAKLASGSEEALALFSDVANKGGDNYIQFIDSSYIVQFTNDTLTTYTMKITTLDEANYSFSNLVIKLQDGVTEESVIHYSPTREWQDAYNIGQRIPYTGDVNVVDTQGNSKAAGTYVCTFSVEPVYDYPECTCKQIIGYDVAVTCAFVPSGGGSGGGGSGGGGNGGSGDDPTGPGGGLPTDPVTGQGGNPCQALNAKLMDTQFIQKISDLKSLLNPYHENGFFNYNPSEVQGQQSNQTNKYNIMGSYTKPDGTKTVKTTVDGPQVFGLMHTHPTNEKSMGVHSSADILTFIELIIGRASFNYSISDTYCIVVGSHGIYSLKLEDLSKLENWVLEYDTKTKRKKYFIEFEKKYFKMREHENIKTNNERSLLQMLDQYYDDLGIGIYRAVEVNNNLTGWQRMSLNANRNPKFTNCN